MPEEGLEPPTRVGGGAAWADLIAAWVAELRASQSPGAMT
jgi:hypothetical protein